MMTYKKALQVIVQESEWSAKQRRGNSMYPAYCLNAEVEVLEHIAQRAKDLLRECEISRQVSKTLRAKGTL